MVYSCKQRGRVSRVWFFLRLVRLILWPIPCFFNRKLKKILYGLKHSINFSHQLYKGNENWSNWSVFSFIELGSGNTFGGQLEWAILAPSFTLLVNFMNCIHICTTYKNTVSATIRTIIETSYMTTTMTYSEDFNRCCYITVDSATLAL